jgi:hypothetical protein
MKPNQVDVIVSMLKGIKEEQAVQSRKLDQLTAFFVALNGEQNEAVNLLRNYISGQADLERRVLRLEMRSGGGTDPCPPDYPNGNGGAE